MNPIPELKTWQYNMLIGIISALFFIPFLGGVHLFDWDEINFAESAREMIESGDYLTVQINFIPFWEKPPLFIWMQVASMKVFGINEFAARFPNAICGIFSLLVIFNIGRKYMDIRFGILWMLFFGTSLLPFFYFKSGIIDPWFNLFIFLGIYHLYLYLLQPINKITHSSGSAFFIGLAILTKGPVAFLVFALCAAIFIFIKRFRINVNIKDVMIFILVLTLTGGFWFILQILKGNYQIISDFIVYQIRLFKTQDAGHGGFLLYHFVVLFIGVFPASVFALPVLFGAKVKTLMHKDFYAWMLILFWVVLILFTIVRTKIVHYSSLCYFPLTFLAAWSLYHGKNFTASWKKISSALLIITGIVLTILVTSITFIDRLKNYFIRQNLIDDPFAVACLNANGNWKGFEFLVGVIMISGLIVFAILWKRSKFNNALFALNLSVSVFMFLSVLLIVPRIETYSQRAAIEFFKSVKDQDAYLYTIGYKSYAHLFYGAIKMHSNELSRDKEWLLNGEIDKPAYFAVKITKKEKFMKDFPLPEYIYEKNGFAFFKRLPD